MSFFPVQRWEKENSRQEISRPRRSFAVINHAIISHFARFTFPSIQVKASRNSFLCLSLSAGKLLPPVGLPFCYKISKSQNAHPARTFPLRAALIYNGHLWNSTIITESKCTSMIKAIQSVPGPNYSWEWGTHLEALINEEKLVIMVPAGVPFWELAEIFQLQRFDEAPP